MAKSPKHGFFFFPLVTTFSTSSSNQRHRLLVQSTIDTVVGGLLGKVVVEQQWGIVGREGAVDP